MLRRILINPTVRLIYLNSWGGGGEGLPKNLASDELLKIISTSSSILSNAVAGMERIPFSK